jgi:hypothetical protein
MTSADRSAGRRRVLVKTHTIGDPSLADVTPGALRRGVQAFRRTPVALG